MLIGSTVKLHDDIGVQSTPRAIALHLETRIGTTSERYLGFYYSHFHHRWPIVHRPSLDNAEPIVLSSMTIIGGWLDGSQQAKSFALESHERLVEDITSQLSRMTRKNKFQQYLSACLCQAALLNIIFGFYTGVRAKVQVFIRLTDTSASSSQCHLEQ